MNNLWDLMTYSHIYSKLDSSQIDNEPLIADWSEAEKPLIYTAQSDVLAILNCCFAGNATLAVEQRSSPDLPSAGILRGRRLHPGARA